MTPQPARHVRRTVSVWPLGALIGACALIAACASPIAGMAKPAENPWPPTSAPSAAATVVPASAIAGKLLTRNELADIIGDTDLNETTAYAKPDYVSDGIDPPDCGARVLVDNTFSYYADDRAAMEGNSNAGAAGKRAGQVVSIWATTKNAKTMVEMSGDEWNQCKEGRQFTVTADNGIAQWTAGPISVAGPRITAMAQRQQPSPRTCTHIITSQLNVVVETVACAADGDTTAQANQIADRILAKFPH